MASASFKPYQWAVSDWGDMSSFRFPGIRLAWTLFSLLLLMNLAVGLAFASSDCSNPKKIQEGPSESLLFTGRVVKFSITDE